MCDYICKVRGRRGHFSTNTILSLVNPSTNHVTGQLVFTDGNENVIGTADIDLSRNDIDNIDLCRTLASAVTPPQAGLVTVVLDADGDSAYSSVRYVSRRSVAVKECRVVPPSVVTAVDVPTGGASVSPFYVEDTNDPTLP